MKFPHPATVKGDGEGLCLDNRNVTKFLHTLPLGIVIKYIFSLMHTMDFHKSEALSRAHQFNYSFGETATMYF